VKRHAVDAAEAARALAEADFMDIPDRFGRAGFDVRLPARGILQITSSAQRGKRLSVLLSVGVHGDETAPIEMLAYLLTALARVPHALAVDLMVVVGNPDAIRQGRRFVDVDMNRLFSSARKAPLQAAEAARADLIMSATAAFFSAPATAKWHLDLHTAIRRSHYPKFAIIPEATGAAGKAAMLAWLGGAGIAAVILNPKPASTYSAYTAHEFGAVSCTAELGQVGVMGRNDLHQLADMQAAIDALIRSGVTQPLHPHAPHVFQVVQEIIKRSDAFQMELDRATQNFTALAPEALIARDGASMYRVGSVTEYVVFPNPDVHIGQRAGLMVVLSEK
jgi:succinylglutamate desuccinylase